MHVKILEWSRDANTCENIKAVQRLEPAWQIDARIEELLHVVFIWIHYIQQCLCYGRCCGFDLSF